MKKMVRLKSVNFCGGWIETVIIVEFTKTDWDKKSIPELYALNEKRILEFLKDVP